MKSFLFIPLLILLQPAIVSAQTYFDPVLAPFYHGVASGDALSDRVIIWTRITSDDSLSFTVNWNMALDTLMAQVIQSGTEVTAASVDYTVKVDVSGLQPDTWYYYQFEHDGRKSLIGRTKTLPVGSNSKVRLAVASCGRYGGGDYYNAYLDIALRNDIQAVIHLGDYIYEGNGSVSGQGIQVLPTHETVTLEDYRQRYSTYRLDPDLRLLHQQYPFYNVWDDHETANDSWSGGAQAHNDTTEGPWAVRKASGQQAYFEWIPIRPKSQGSYSIYRSFNIGNLVDLIMIDTRLEGRDKQADAFDQIAYADTNRTILGQTQMQWLKSELSNSQSRWRIIGNQVMFAPLELLSLGLSYDQWDGYSADRKRLVSHVMDNSINNIFVITGDIHTSWANDVPQEGVSYNPSTGSGSAFVEFVGPSISTGSPVDNALVGAIKFLNPHIKFVDLLHSGYMILDIDSNHAQSDWQHVSTLADRNYTVSQAASWYVNNDERFLRQASSPASGTDNTASFAPLTVDNIPLGVTYLQAKAGVDVYPNPALESVALSFVAQINQDVSIQITDLSGREMLRVNKHFHQGRNEVVIDISALERGMYLIRLLESDLPLEVLRLVKMK